MPKCKMLVNANFDQLRVAIIGEKGLLEQVDFESLHNSNNLGNIYKATITAIEPSLQAAFVDYGGNRHGFLPFNEIHHRYFVNNDRRLSSNERLKVGQHVIIQVAREEIGLKGAYMTTFLSLPGQYLVMMPLTSKVGISRKIENLDDRRSVRDLLEQISVPDGMGYIIRTAGLGKTREQLQRDLNLLTTTWGELESRAANVPSPTLLYQEDDVVTRTIRDYYNEDVGEVLVDDENVFATVMAYFKKVMPNYAQNVKLYRSRSPLFARFRIDDQVESIFASKIILPSGGSIVIEQTEALVVIDVNSGKTAEGNLEATALKSNLEAAEEVARQLRLRDLGGLIVIDFIDLKEKRHSLEVEQRLRDCLKKDKARITVTGLSRFGLLEMSRQRINTSKEIRHYVDCPHCLGHGRIKSLEMQALDLLRKARALLSSKPVKELKITCGDELGIHLLNERREELSTLEQQNKATVRIIVKSGFTGAPSFDATKRSLQEEKNEMVMPPPLSLSTMAASMSDKAINEQKDYREEKLEALDKMTFEELRAIEIAPPVSLSPFDRFNFSVRVTMMKRHGLYEDRLEEFREAVREGILKGGRKIKLDSDADGDGDEGDDQDLDEHDEHDEHGHEIGDDYDADDEFEDMENDQGLLAVARAEVAQQRRREQSQKSREAREQREYERRGESREFERGRDNRDGERRDFRDNERGRDNREERNRDQRDNERGRDNRDGERRGDFRDNERGRDQRDNERGRDQRDNERSRDNRDNERSRDNREGDRRDNERGREERYRGGREDRRDNAARDGGPRENGQRERGFRDGGPRDGGPRDGGPRDGGPRDGGKPDNQLEAAENGEAREGVDQEAGQRDGGRDRKGNGRGRRGRGRGRRGGRQRREGQGEEEGGRVSREVLEARSKNV